MTNEEFFDYHFDQFFKKSKNIPYLDNGIFDSELFAMYSFFQKLQCDLFIESGICYGYSTNIMLQTLNAQHIGIDISKEYLPYYTKFTTQFTNFQFIVGNSFDIIPNLIENNANKKIFISIDGPKEDKAIQLKNICIKYDNVLAVSVHDNVDTNTRNVFSTKNNESFNKKYFDILNTKQKNKKHSDNKNNSYVDVYPDGPGLVIYTKKTL